MTPPGQIHPVEIRKSRTVYVVGTILIGGFTLGLIGLQIRAALLGRAPQEPVNAFLVPLMLVGITGWSLWNALDRRIRILLTAEGFHDFGGDGALVPWSEVRTVTIGHSDTLVVGMKEGSPNRVLNVRALDLSGRGIIDYAKRAAPHIGENVVDLLELGRK